MRCSEVGDTIYQLVYDCVQAVDGVPRIGTRDIGSQGLKVYLTGN